MSISAASRRLIHDVIAGQFRDRITHAAIPHLLATTVKSCGFLEKITFSAMVLGTLFESKIAGSICIDYFLRVDSFKINNVLSGWGMRKISIIVVMLLSGCDSNSIRNGPTVTPDTVRSYMSTSCSVPPGSKSYSAYDFFVAGIGAARLQCDNYMLALINANRDSRFASSSIATASSQTALILAATASNATKPIAVIAAASEFVRQIISGYSNEYAFASFAQEIYPQLHTIMNAYLADSRTIQVVSRIKADPYSTASYCIATDIVRTFASNCSPVNIDSNVRAAISSAKPSETSPGVTDKDTSQVDTQQRSLPLPHRPRPSGASQSQSLALPTYTLGR